MILLEGGERIDSNGQRANDVMKMAIGGQFWKGFTLAPPVVLPSTSTHSQDSVMVLCPMDGQHGRMMISGEEGGNTFTHTGREGGNRRSKGGRAVAAPIYPSRPNWFLMCGFLLPTDRGIGENGVE